MVYVKHLTELISFQLQTIGNERTLKIAHTAFSSVDASMKRGDGTWGKTIDTTRNKTSTVALVKKSDNLFIVVHIHIERFLVVYIICYTH